MPFEENHELVLVTSFVNGDNAVVNIGLDSIFTKVVFGERVPGAMGMVACLMRVDQNLPWPRIPGGV